jgi:uncharacterized protein (TIGR02996 family)
MLDEFPFLRALYHRPDDDGLRLIYADWLDDRGDPRGEYLRREVESRGRTGSGKRKSELSARVAELAANLDSRWLGRIWQSRDMPPGVRLDLTVVADGKRSIEVRGDGVDVVLLVEGQPVALNWDDSNGSIGQYLVFTGHTPDADYARQLAGFVEGEIDAARSLADQIEPLLAHFVPGTYCLRYTPSAAARDIGTLEYAHQSAANFQLENYYPYEQGNLVCTQMTETLIDNRVMYFRRQIRTGQRPIILTASAEGAWCEFVIDGHHKLAAYDREQVSPAVLSIVRWDAPAITLKEGLGYLPTGHPGIAEYRRVKRPHRP